MAVAAKFLACVPAMLLIALNGCTGTLSDISKTEVTRVASPQKKYDIVSIAVEGGATVASRNELYVMKHGEKNVDRTMFFLQSNGEDAPGIEWVDEENVILKVGGRKISHFKNYVYVGNYDGYDHEIRFYLK